MQQKFGVHVSIVGGYTEALRKVHAMGGNCLQIFSTSPRIWKAPNIDDEQTHSFRALKQELDIDPIYFHAGYLINLAASGRIGALSVQTLIQELTLASHLGVRGSIIHLGFLKQNYESGITNYESLGYKTLIQNITHVLQNTPDNTSFIIENAGSRKIGASIEEIGNIIHTVNNNRVRVCLDTCHLHAAGYALSSKERFEAFFKKFDSLIGLDQLEVFQINDSKDPFASFRDRHENLGDGTVGLEVFRLLVNDLRTKEKPFIIEVPGEQKQGPDKKNLDILKSFTRLDKKKSSVTL